MSIILAALLTIIPCTGDLATPNPDNDVICWQPIMDEPALAGFVVYWRDTTEDSWVPVGETSADFNWWTETPMVSGQYCVKSLDDLGRLSADCSSIVQWNPCAQWNIDIELIGPPCVPQTCAICDEWQTCPFAPPFRCCVPGQSRLDPECTVVTCAPPIPADWPATPCEKLP